MNAKTRRAEKTHDITYIHLNESGLAVLVQQTASRDEVETVAKDASTAGASIREGMNESSERFPTTPLALLRKIHKIKKTVVDSNAKRTKRKKKEVNITLPKSDPSNTKEPEQAILEVIPVKSSVHISSPQGSISTLSHHDTYRLAPKSSTTMADVRPVKHSTSQVGAEEALDTFDLSFDEMSFSNEQPNLSQKMSQPMDIWSACRIGDEGFVRGALAHSPDLLMQTQQGRTPLYCAAHAGQASVVKLLLEMGANDPDGTAYMSALNKGCRRLLAKARVPTSISEVLEHPRDHIIVVPGGRTLSQHAAIHATSHVEQPPIVMDKPCEPSSPSVDSLRDLPLETVTLSYRSSGPDETLHLNAGHNQHINDGHDAVSMSSLGIDNEDHDDDSSSDGSNSFELSDDDDSEDTESTWSASNSASYDSSDIESQPDELCGMVESSKEWLKEQQLQRRRRGKRRGRRHRQEDPYSCEWILATCE